MRIRLTASIAIFLAAALLAGCGSSDGDSGSTGSAPANGTGATAPAGASAHECETQAADAEALRATNLGCEQARQLMFAWQRDPDCVPAKGASRSGCSIRAYRCLSVVTAKGVSASCAQPGRSIAFMAHRG